MKNFKTIIAVAALTLSTAAVAQNIESAYYAHGSLYRHDVNPAVGNDNGYFAMPILGNMNVNFSGNLNLENFLFARDGKTVTFMHPDISKDEFLGNIKDRNELNQSLKLQILSFGFKGFGGYNTFELNTKENLNVSLPGSIFELAKEGLSNRTYNIDDLDMHADAYVELALGHSRQINEKLRVGAKLKALFGVANFDANINNAYITLGADGKYEATVDGEMHANLKGVEMKNKAKKVITPAMTGKDREIDDINVDGAGLGGFGLAVDLGATYKLNDSWTFSASLLDLGYINWSTDAVAKASGTHSINMNDYSYNMDEKEFLNKDPKQKNDKGNRRTLDDAFDDFSDAFTFNGEGDQGSRSKGLAATMNLGAEYTAPFYDKLTFGLLNTTRFGEWGWTDFRLSANVAPVKWFSASVSLSTGTYGTGFGWVLDLHPKGIGLFVAMDRTPGKVTKEFVPLNSNMDFTFGLNFPF